MIAAKVSAVTATALAPSTLSRRGIAVSVVRIMPVLYSPLIASTARMATTAWLRSMPDRAILAGSWPQPAAREPVPVPAVAAESVRENHQAAPPPATETAAEPPAATGEAAAQAEAGAEQTGRQSRKAARGRRSSVPSWDEIMFGSSRQRD